MAAKPIPEEIESAFYIPPFILSDEVWKELYKSAEDDEEFIEELKEKGLYDIAVKLWEKQKSK